MSIDERRRLELAEAAKRVFGDDAGVTLMEMLPPVGWADVATKRDLDSVKNELMSSFNQELNQLTWRFLGGMLAMLAAFAAVIKI